jgi:di/tricarboxylate transporter
MVSKAGSSHTRLMVLMMVMVAVLSAIISVNGAVAALLPMVVVVALRATMPPSRLLMPLAFGAHAGSQLALTGTPIHILVSDAAVEAGVEGFNYFEFAFVGVPLVIGAIAIVVLFGRRLIPDREPDRIAPDLSGHARTLVSQYEPGEWIARLQLPEGSELVGSTADQLDLSEFPDVSVTDVQGKVGSIGLNGPMPEASVITVKGPSQQISDLATRYDLARQPCALSGTAELMDRQVGVVEVVIPPRSEIIGEHVVPGMTTASGDFVILAVQRQGADVGLRGSQLRVGDTMLIQGTWDALDRGLDVSDVLVVDLPADVRRQAVPMGPGSRQALVILIAMVVLLASGVVTAAVAALLAAGALILSRVVTVQQAYRSISWTTVVLIAAMIPVSTAVQQSGAAEDIADLLVGVVGDAGPYALLFGLFLITAFFGQLISNTATALIVIPIAVTAAIDLGVSVRPVMMSITVAAAAAFLTPVATPANLMVMEPAGYKFTDYWKLGLPMLLMFGAAAVLLVPVFWPF